MVSEVTQNQSIAGNVKQDTDNVKPDTNNTNPGTDNRKPALTTQNRHSNAKSDKHNASQTQSQALTLPLASFRQFLPLAPHVLLVAAATA